MKTLLILGATGQIGSKILDLALNHPEIFRVIAPTRRPLARHDKLDNPIVNFEQLPATAQWWKTDIALCALGTTLRQAKSRAGFYRVDHDYVLSAAKLCQNAGTPAFAMVSSLGASPTSLVFYLKTKGETERDINALGFASLTIARPSLLIGGPRSTGRPLEAMGLFLGKHLSALLPQRYKAVSTLQVADILLKTSLNALPGSHILESEQLSANPLP